MILTLMRWAVAMEDISYEMVASQRLSTDAAHERRVIVKRRFRQFIAVWSRRPFRGSRLIKAYTGRGWAAIVAEPRRSVDTSQALNPRSTWRSIRYVDPRQSGALGWRNA